jgi:hypothetical protein
MTKSTLLETIHGIALLKDTVSPKTYQSKVQKMRAHLQQPEL